MKKKFENLVEKLKSHFREIIKVKKSGHSIALGFAVGTFISILPTPGFNLLLGLLVVLIFKNISKISLFFAIFFWNPLTMIPIYTLNYKIGNIIFGAVPVVEYKMVLLDQALNFTRRYLIGSFIVGIIISTASYFVTRGILWVYRKERKLLSPKTK